MTTKRKNLGNNGEDLAEEYLTKNNYKIIARNKIYKQGEIDIIAQDGDYIVLVEVKTKTIFDQGTPEEMVNYFKIRKLKLLGKVLSKEYPNNDLRIDVVAVDLTSRTPKINHIINAIEG